MIKYPKSAKTRLINCFWFLVYPDSAPEDWQNKLDDLMVTYLISPLHDKDVLEDGSAKKAHYHVMIIFEGGKSQEFCEEIMETVGSANMVGDVVVDKRKAIRYLVHADQPAKYQYNKYDIVCSGYNVGKYFEDDDFSINVTAVEIISFIRDKRIRYFNVLLDYCIENNKGDWFKRLRSDLCPVIKNYMAGMRYQIDDEFKVSKKHKNFSVHND